MRHLFETLCSPLHAFAQARTKKLDEVSGLPDMLAEPRPCSVIDQPASCCIANMHSNFISEPDVGVKGSRFSGLFR